MAESSLTHVEQPLDIYRSTCLRYLGYFGLLPKIFSPALPRTIFHTIAASYITSDVVDKATKNATKETNKCETFVKTCDAFIWQAASTLLIPTCLINGFSEQAAKLQSYRTFAKFRPAMLTYMLGVAFMPFLSKPIDKSVNCAMDLSYRKWLKIDSPHCERLFGPNGGLSYPKIVEPQKIEMPQSEGSLFNKIYEEMQANKRDAQEKKDKKAKKKKDKKKRGLCGRKRKNDKKDAAHKSNEPKKSENQQKK